MAVKRKHQKMRLPAGIRHASIARMKPRGSEVSAASKDLVPDDLLDQAALPESHASGVMLVITIVSLIFIGFIAWCVSQMPVK